MLTWSKMTICHFGYFYFSFLFLFCSVSAIWCLAMFEKHSKQHNIGFDKICIGDHVTYMPPLFIFLLFLLCILFDPGIIGKVWKHCQTL